MYTPTNSQQVALGQKQKSLVLYVAKRWNSRDGQMNPVEQISTDLYPSFDMDTGSEEEFMEHCLEYFMPGWLLLQ